MTNRSHDHELSKTTYTAANTLQLDIVRDSKGRAMYQVFEDVPQYQNPLEVTQRDWSGGHGTLWWDGRPVYYDGQSIDTMTPGKVFLGQEASNNSPYLLVLNFYTYDEGTTTYTDATTASQNATVNDMNLTEAAPAVDDAVYFRMNAASDTELRILIGTQGAGTWTIIWEYYNGSAWAALAGISDGTTGFTAATGMRLVSWSSTLSSVSVNGQAGFWIRARVSAFTSIATRPLGTQAWYGGVVVSSFGTAPIQFIQWAATAKSYCATITKIFEYGTGGVSQWFEKVAFTGDSITHLCEHNDILYIGRGASTLWYYTTDGGTFTQTDLTNAYANYFLSAPNPAGTAQVLWFAKIPNEIRQTSDGRTVAAGGVAVSSVAYVGDSSANIISLFLNNDNLMVGREDGLFHYDADGGVHPLMQELRQNKSTNSFKYVCNYKGAVYCSVVTGLAELTGYNTIRMVGALDHIDDIGKSGTVVGLTSDKDFIYVAMDEGTNTHIYKGRELEVDGVLRWEWCPWVSLGTGSCATIEAVQIGASRYLWIGYQTLYQLLTIHDNYLTDSSSFASTGFIRLPYLYGTNPYWSKLFQSVITETSQASATYTVQPKYRKDAETSMTNLTAAITTNGVVKTNLSSAIACNRIQFELDFAGASASTAVVSYFQARGVEVPEVTRIHEVYYSIGTTPSQRAETIRTFLRDLRSSTSLVRFADLRYGDNTNSTDDTYTWVVMQPGYPQELEVVHEDGRTPEMAVKCRFQEVSFTVS